MIRLLYVINLLVLISAGVVFAVSGRLWFDSAPTHKNEPEISVADRFYTLGSLGGENSQDVIFPLVKQATAYALHLEPPKPPMSKRVPRPTANMRAIHRPLGIAPKFRLLSTSYYCSSPEKSLALVSEPGKGDHWIKKDERLGQFVVESIEKGSLFYRDGSQLREMKIPTKVAVQLAHVKPDISRQTQAIKPNLRLLNTAQSTNVE